MNSILNLFSQAQLAEVAYSNVSGITSSTDPLVLQSRLINLQPDGSYDLSPAQATAFVQNWRIASQFSESGLLSNGFSATLLERLGANQQPTGQYTLAFRGSQEIVDFAGADLDLAVTSVARNQLISMMNYALRLQAGEAGFAQQLNATGTGLTQNLVPGAGPGIALDLLTVSGHSLGGYLAQVYQRLFGSVGVFTFNALGITDPNASFFNQVTTLLGLPAGNFGSGNGDNLLVRGEPAQLIGTVQGKPQIQIFTETEGPQLTPFNTNPVAAHQIPYVTDALAVYDLFAKIDPALNTTDPAVGISKITEILRALSNKAPQSLETAVDALVNLFGLAFEPLTGANVDNRDELYRRIITLQTVTTGLATNNPDMQVDSLIGAGNLALLATGSEALAYRYALKALNPFAITGSNALYTIHNENGELDLYDPVTKSGSLTSAWLTDRAQMLAFAITANTNDARSFGSNQVTDQVRYTDVAKLVAGTGGDFVVHLPGAPANFNGPNTRRITFGDDSGNYLQGADNVDHLYGQGGSDYLQGKRADDILEGGRSMDVYEYNGYKSFGGTLTNDGEDTILDTDGKGVLRYVFNEGGLLGIGAKSTSTIIHDASIRISGTQWNSADGKFTYQRVQNDLIVIINGDAGGRITLKDFKEGDFGIHLLDAQRDAPVTTRDIFGDRAPQVFTATFLLNVPRDPKVVPILTIEVQVDENGLPVSETIDYHLLDDLGNLVTVPGVVSREDALFGGIAGGLTAPGEKFVTGDERDIIWSDRPNSDPDTGLGNVDWIVSGAGRDNIQSGAGNDLIEAGADGIVSGRLGGGFGIPVSLAGGDLVYAGSGDDEVYGDTKIALSLAIRNGETDLATNVVGDFLSGGQGDDWIVAGAANDALLGGDGSDILVGGAGNDDLFGDRDLIPLERFFLVPDNVREYTWAVTRQISGNGANLTYTSSIENVTQAPEGDGGNDVIYGGAGDDWAFGGKGDDFIDGGSGRDVLIGEAGSDVLIGGTEDDVLIGDGPSTPFGEQGADYLDGGDGNDTLQGDGGDDVLIGGIGDDQLLGGEGNDILIGGPGLDVLQGGSGKDTYVFNRGDGTEIIVDTARDAKDPEASVVVFGDGITRSDIKFRPGSLMVDLGPSNADDPLAGNDQIHFTNFNGDYPDLTAAIGEIRFADGSSMDYAEILAQGFDIDGTAFDDVGGTALIGTSVTDRIRGFAGSDELEGRDGDDVLIGDGGGDRLDGGNGNDVLDGGAGNDFLAGGMGSDDYRFIRGDGSDTLVEGSLFVPGLSDPTSTDRIVFGEDITRAEVSLFRAGDGSLTVGYGAGDTIRVEGQYSVASADIENIVFADGQVIDKAELDALEVGVLQGTAGDDELIGTAGDDVLNGGAGSDTYALYWGMGNDRIIDVPDGQTNTLTLLEGATLDSVKTTREGDDLLVTLRGGGGSATVQGFFTDGGAASWQIASEVDGNQSLLDFYDAQSAVTNAHVVDAKADYKQQLMGEWRAGSQPNLELPTRVYVNSTWSQTTATWTQVVPALPNPVVVTQTFVNDPVTHTAIQGFGTVQGNRTVALPIFGNMVIQRLADVFVEQQVSDNAVITMQNSGGSDSATLSYSFFAGGGGPFGNARTYQTQSGFLVNTIVESSAEGWVPLNLREDNLGSFQLNVNQIIDELVIEEITAGAGNNTIFGATENSSDTIALIDAGAGDDVVTAGQYDFVFGNDGDDEISGGAYAYGGNGFDALFDGRFMAGGADDDFLSGGAGETTFHFRSDEAGWDWVEDRNGISLTEFAFNVGFSSSYSNLIYGGKYRYLDTNFSYGNAVNDWIERHPEWSGFTGAQLGHGLPYYEAADFYNVLGNSDVFPRGVADLLARDVAPAWGDGYYTSVFNSVEDMMRDFADLGVSFNPTEVQVIPEVADLSDFTADNYAALQPFFESSVLEKDVVELADFQIGIDELKVGFGYYDELDRVLRLVWGDDKAIDIVLPFATDLIGSGIEEVRLGSESVYIGDLIDIAKEEGFLASPFGGDLVGTAGNDRIRGLAGWDFIEGGAGNDVLSGGLGIDEFFFGVGAGSDTILDPDAEDLILFGNGVTPEQIQLGLGSLRLRYGDAGDEIHFQGFNPDDVYGATLFAALQFYDTSTWTLQDELTYDQVLNRGFDIAGTDGDDTLRGTNIHDRFEGGKGNDVLTGGSGSDTYFFNAGDGNDTINDIAEAGEVNRVVLRDYLETDITGTQEGGFVVLRAGAGDAIRIRWDGAGSGVDQVEFADGAMWDRAMLAQLPLVVGNSPPVVDVPLPAQVALEDAVFSFIVPDTTFRDPDAGDVLNYAATRSDGSALPAWLSFDPLSRTFSGTPDNDDVGALSVAVTAADAANATATTAFDLTIVNTNDTPVVAQSVADMTAIEDLLFSYTVPAGVFADVDAGDVLTLNAALADGSLLPGWLQFNPATRTFSGTPENADVGAVVVRLTATDQQGASVDEEFSLVVVDVNDAPVVSQPLTDAQSTEDIAFNYTVPADTFTDVDVGDTLTFSATLVNGAALPTWLAFDAATRAFSGTPPGGTAGELGLRVVATDTAGAQAAADFQLLVQAGNRGVTLTGTPASESLTGTPFDDFIDGRGGNDLVYGLDGNDQLFGGDGADQLYGGAGNDTLDGGAGADLLEGGPGADVYLFGRGSGRDVIFDRGQTGDIDTVRLDATISLNQLKFSTDDADLTLRIANTADRLTIRDWRSSRDGVETLQLADGQSFNLRALVNAKHDDDDHDDDHDDGHDSSHDRRHRDTLAEEEHEAMAAERIRRNANQGAHGTPGSSYGDYLTKKSSHGRDQSNFLDTQYLLDAMERFDREHESTAVDSHGETASRKGIRGSVYATPAANPGLSQSVLANALMQYHLSVSEDAAPGGDMVFFRAMAHGGGVALSHQGVGGNGFGSDAQSLREFSGLREGLVHLG